METETQTDVVQAQSSDHPMETFQVTEVACDGAEAGLITEAGGQETPVIEMTSVGSEPGLILKDKIADVQPNHEETRWTIDAISNNSQIERSSLDAEPQADDHHMETSIIEPALNKSEVGVIMETEDYHMETVEISTNAGATLEGRKVVSKTETEENQPHIEATPLITDATAEIVQTEPHSEPQVDGATDTKADHPLEMTPVIENMPEVQPFIKTGGLNLMETIPAIEAESAQADIEPKAEVPDAQRNAEAGPLIAETIAEVVQSEPSPDMEPQVEDHPMEVSSTVWNAPEVQQVIKADRPMETASATEIAPERAEAEAKVETQGYHEAAPMVIEVIHDALNPTIDPSSSSEALNKFLHDLQNSGTDPSALENAEEQAKRFFEDLILSSATYDTPCKIDIATATDEEKAAERKRRLYSRRTHHRFVFQDWPRDPNGKPVMKDGPERKGKQTSNGLEIWGATLFDFYMFRRFPEQKSGVTFSSGSRIAAWMKTHGEDYAKDQLAAVEEEEEPHFIWPCPISKLIMDGEQRSGSTKSWNRSQDTDVEGPKREDWKVPDIWPPKSIFSPQAYPFPWPDKIFEGGKLPTLQSYITQGQLPAKLVVHDSRKILRANGRRAPATDDDITHVYKLVESKKHTERAKFDENELKESDAKRRRIRDKFLRDPHSSKDHPSGIMLNRRDTPGPCAPVIFVVYPHLPERGRIPEAHLYLSPYAALGQGNHSYVYRAEFELPRSFLVDEVMCTQCVAEDLMKILEEQDGPNCETRDPKWDQPTGRYEYKVTHKTSAAKGFFKGEDGVAKERLIRCPEDIVELAYVGLYRAIETRVQYQNLALGPYCEHLEKDNIHPLTAKVSVAAKLSINGDRHLEREAENYQAFPRHFFEHWNGYNIVYPVHHPVPVTPVIPQYYGYYAVSERYSNRKEGEDVDDDEYLSPILLLEDCGTSIDPEELSADDKNECAALVFKFHQGGWTHGSIARRNIVRQPGPLNAFPEQRKLNAKKRDGRGEDWSYRLIDFGRSTFIETNSEAYKTVLEERTAMDNWIHDGPIQL